MSEYHKIETLFERDEKTFRVLPEKLRKPVFGMLKEWGFTEKIDGTNIRLIWKDGKFSVGGKSDNAQIHADLLKHLYELTSAEKLAEVFPDVSAVIYGEGYGAGIQKGGGYSPTKKFAAFDVLVDGKWWLDWENVCDVAAKLHLETVPFIGDWSLEQGIDYARAGFNTFVPGADPMTKAEGIVGRPKETLFDKKGARVIIKLKTKDF
jgi:RNA ligase